MDLCEIQISSHLTYLYRHNETTNVEEFKNHFICNFWSNVGRKYIIFKNTLFYYYFKNCIKAFNTHTKRFYYEFYSML